MFTNTEKVLTTKIGSTIQFVAITKEACRGGTGLFFFALKPHYNPDVQNNQTAAKHGHY
jgi:hypothetical protein